MGTITIQDVENSTIEVHGSGQYVSASLAVSVIEQQAETIERLRAALTNVKNCTESELAAYVKSVDSIACETLAKLEAGDL